MVELRKICNLFSLHPSFSCRDDLDDSCQDVLEALVADSHPRINALLRPEHREKFKKMWLNANFADKETVARLLSIDKLCLSGKVDSI